MKDHLRFLGAQSNTRSSNPTHTHSAGPMCACMTHAHIGHCVPNTKNNNRLGCIFDPHRGLRQAQDIRLSL